MQEKQGLSGWVNVALRNHCEGTIVREESKQKGLAALPRVWRGLSAGLWEMGSILWRWRVALSDVSPSLCVFLLIAIILLLTL